MARRSPTKKIRITMSLYHIGDLGEWLIDSGVPYLVKFNYQRKWVKSRTAIDLMQRFSSGNPQSRINLKTGEERLIKLDLMLRRTSLDVVRDNLMLLNIKYNRRYSYRGIPSATTP